MINLKGTRVDGLLQVDWSDEVASKYEWQTPLRPLFSLPL